MIIDKTAVLAVPAIFRFDESVPKNRKHRRTCERKKNIISCQVILTKIVEILASVPKVRQVCKKGELSVLYHGGFFFFFNATELRNSIFLASEQN